MYFSKLVESICPYVAGEQPQDKKYIKINTNENPYPPSKEVEKIIKSYDYSSLRLYPDPDSNVLAESLSKIYNVGKENIFLGNGSDEVLAMCFPAFFDPNDLPVAFADITYSFYKVWANMYKINTHVIPLNENFEIDANDYINLGNKVKGIIITNPNAPTGIILDKQDLISIIKANKDKVVIVDEAYVDFANYSMAEYIKEFDNLLVVRTFSKSYSLAGIRCGFALGNAKLISALNTIKNSINSYTVNRLTQSVAKAAIEDREYFESTINKIVQTREWTVTKLKELGFYVLPSSSNFVFAKHIECKGKDLYLNLKKKGVLVRHFDLDRIRDYLRITIGTQEEMEKLIETLIEIM